MRSPAFFYGCSQESLDRRLCGRLQMTTQIAKVVLLSDFLWPANERRARDDAEMEHVPNVPAHQFSRCAGGISSEVEKAIDPRQEDAYAGRRAAKLDRSM